MEEKRVSIIVGVYNSGQFLRKGLESIKSQTWNNIEVLLMDDGSIDNSGEICDEFSNKDKRFISIHKSNTGICDSRNKGLEIATGDYVCFMDGDDWLCNDFVEYMMELIKTTNTKMAISDKVFTTRDQIQSLNDRIEVWNTEKAISSIIYPYMKLGPWNKIYSMDIIHENNIRFPDHWFGETLHFASDVAYYSQRIGVGHRKVYNYRLNNANSGTTQYNVYNRQLSLDNCQKLREKAFYSFPKVRNAVEWRIYTDKYILIENIICSKKKEEYFDEYTEAKKYLRQHLFSVLNNSQVNLKQKIKIVLEALSPELLAKSLIRYHKLKFKRDKME